MKFNIGKQYFNSDDKSGVFKLSPDPSLLYNDFWTDYKEYVVSLSGNWRFELTVDSDTGRCIKAQVGLLSGLNVKRVDLILPESERRELYFVADEIMQPGSGCYYLPFSDEVCYDENNKCLSYPSSLYRLQENFNVIRMPPSLKFI